MFDKEIIAEVGRGIAPPDLDWITQPMCHCKQKNIACRAIAVPLTIAVLIAGGCAPSRVTQSVVVERPASAVQSVVAKSDPDARELIESRTRSSRQRAWLAMSARRDSFSAARLEAEIVRRTNELRERYGLAPLRYNRSLSTAARAHSEEMARKDYFDHISPTSGRRTAEDRLSAQGLGFSVSAENIAKEPMVERYWSDGTVEWRSWEEVASNTVRHWFNSEGHRRNLLRSEVTEIGVGAAATPENQRPYVLVTQNFRRP